MPLIRIWVCTGASASNPLTKQVPILKLDMSTTPYIPVEIAEELSATGDETISRIMGEHASKFFLIDSASYCVIYTLLFMCTHCSDKSTKFKSTLLPFWKARVGGETLVWVVRLFECGMINECTG